MSTAIDELTGARRDVCRRIDVLTALRGDTVDADAVAHVSSALDFLNSTRNHIQSHIDTCARSRNHSEASLASDPAYAQMQYNEGMLLKLHILLWAIARGDHAAYIPGMVGVDVDILGFITAVQEGTTAGNMAGLAKTLDAQSLAEVRKLKKLKCKLVCNYCWMKTPAAACNKFELSGFAVFIGGAQWRGKRLLGLEKIEQEHVRMYASTATSHTNDYGDLYELFTAESEGVMLCSDALVNSQ
jgi:hypothetical protein